MDNNNEFDQAFHRFKQHPRLSVSKDFEVSVFSKIKKKRNQRKIVTSVSLVIFLFVGLLIAQMILSQKDTETTLIARPESAIKEEVPVMDDVIFASSDSRTNYAIEQVSYYDDDTI
jgi:hypothetical protein